MYLDRKALDRAGIRDASLRTAYRFCRDLLNNWEDSALMGASTAFLPLRKRPPMWALAAFLWQTDAILDTGDPAFRRERYDTWCTQVRAALAAGTADDPVCLALLHTMRSWGMAADDVDAVLDGLRPDLTVTEYRTYTDLERYIHGLHRPVVRLGLRIMEPVAADAEDRAMAFATATQLMDFVCDVPEDVDLGRTYLPLDELRAFGLTPADLAAPTSSPEFRNLIHRQVDRVRHLWDYGKGLAEVVEPGCRPWLLRGIHEFEKTLTELDRRDYDIALSAPRFGARTWGVLTNVR